MTSAVFYRGQSFAIFGHTCVRLGGLLILLEMIYFAVTGHVTVLNDFLMVFALAMALFSSP